MGGAILKNFTIATGFTNGIFINRATQLTIKDCRIQGVGKGTGTGIEIGRIDNVNCLGSNINIYNCYFNGYDTIIDIVRGTTTRMRDCIFESATTAIKAYGTSVDVQVFHPYFELVDTTYDVTSTAILADGGSGGAILNDSGAKKSTFYRHPVYLEARPANNVAVNADTWTQIPIDAFYFEEGFDKSSGNIVVEQHGVYLITAQVGFTPADTSQQYKLKLKLNSNDILRSEREFHFSADAAETISLLHLVRSEVNDEVGLYMYWDGAEGNITVHNDKTLVTITRQQ